MVDLSSIHIARWGSSGPRVVLVHGGAQGTETGGERNFAFQKPLAEQGWQLIVPDRPGHGRSPDPGRPDDAEADGAWVAELLGDGAHLVGHSFGGCVALAAAAKRPAAVRSLTLIEPGMLKMAASSPAVRRWVLRVAATTLFSLSAVSRARRFMKIVGIPEELQNQDPEVLKRLGRALARGRIPDKATLERQLTEIRRAAIPLLVVSGGWSPAFEATGDIVADAGGGRHEVVSSGRHLHFPQFVAEEFNPLLAAFLKESDAR